MNKLGRNEPCHCGSGKKYKKCSLRKDEEERCYDLEVQSGRIEPFAGDDDWKKEPEEDWGKEDVHDAASGFPSDPAPESRKDERGQANNA